MCSLKKNTDSAIGYFIDSGSPDSYLMGLVDDASDTTFLNDTASLLMNVTLNGTRLLGNYSDALEPESDENLAETIVLYVTSVMLGFMILITVIGNV